MIRVLNFFCVAAMGLTILALYHVSEHTRLARVELGRVEDRIAADRMQMSELQAQWQQVSRPDRIQQLAQSTLDMSDTATVQLSSLELLPRRGDDAAPLAQARTANAQMPAPQPAQLVKVSARSGM
jgi:cell division protein FtsL